MVHRYGSTSLRCTNASSKCTIRRSSTSKTIFLVSNCVYLVKKCLTINSILEAKNLGMPGRTNILSHCKIGQVLEVATFVVVSSEVGGKFNLENSGRSESLLISSSRDVKSSSLVFIVLLAAVWMSRRNCIMSALGFNRWPSASAIALIVTSS